MGKTKVIFDSYKQYVTIYDDIHIGTKSNIAHA